MVPRTSPLPVRRSPAARRLAWFIALAADALQIVAMPLLGEGLLSPANDVLDVLVGVTLCLLLGWHFAFLPALAAELIPGVDLVPTWTAAVFLATRGMKSPEDGPTAPARPRSYAEIVEEPGEDKPASRDPEAGPRP
jgi:hypothetical protein